MIDFHDDGVDWSWRRSRFEQMEETFVLTVPYQRQLTNPMQPAITSSEMLTFDANASCS